MKQVEIGGYLPLELYKSNEYYKNNLIRLNSARNAILLATQDGNYKKLYIPIYLCPSVSKTLLNGGIHVVYYNIDNNFMPRLTLDEIEQIQNEGGAILVVNYFGLIAREQIIKLQNIYKNLIIDNTQAFYCKPICGAYNVYSCRKFFGVSDGAYLIKEGIGHYNLEQDRSAMRAMYLLNSIETGSNESYKMFISSEEELNSNKILSMSILTRSILSSIDYEYVKESRINNYKFLSSKLDKYNELKVHLQDDMVPMVYPFMYSNVRLRQYLLENRVYVSQWWKNCINNEYSSNVENDFSQYLLPLPIDQRYNKKAMQIICKLILDFIWEEK